LEISSPNSNNVQMLLVRNFATSATGNFTGNYTAEIRGASSGNLAHAMLIHLNEENATRRILDVTSTYGTVATFRSDGVVLIRTASGVTGGGALQVNGNVNINGVFQINGVTIGGGGGSVSAPNAPQGGNEVLGLQLLGAQKELLEAQTEKTKAETTKTSGVDTKLTQELGETEEIKNQMMKDTYEETFSKIRAEAERAEEEWRKAAAEGKVAEATADMEIEKVKADLAGIGITNELRKSQKNLTDAEITETVNRVAQRWEEIGVQKGRLELEKWVRDVADSTKLAVETVSRIATTVLGRGEKGVETPKMERGWSERHGEWWKTKE